MNFANCTGSEDTQAIYGAKNTAQALNNINKAGKFTAAKGKGAPRPPSFLIKGRSLEYETWKV